MAIARIEEVIDDLRQGKMIILVDDEGRENEDEKDRGQEYSPFHLADKAPEGLLLIKHGLGKNFERVGR